MPRCSLPPSRRTLFSEESEAVGVWGAALTGEEAADSTHAVVQLCVLAEKDVADLFDASQLTLRQVALAFGEVFVAEGGAIGVSVPVELGLEEWAERVRGVHLFVV